MQKRRPIWIDIHYNRMYLTEWISLSLNNRSIVAANSNETQ